MPRQELGLNAFGERVYIDDHGNLKVVDRVTGKSVFPPKRKPTPVVKNCPPSLTEQVRAELKRPGNERVIASVDQATGQSTTVMAPVPYYAASFGSLTAAERAALETERKQLIQSLPNLVWGDRVKAQKRIREIERDLDVGRFNDESERRHKEREAERKREQYGR